MGFDINLSLNFGCLKLPGLLPLEALKTLSFEASIQLSDVNNVTAPADTDSPTEPAYTVQ
jgi:hypothetical protein